MDHIKNMRKMVYKHPSFKNAHEHTHLKIHVTTVYHIHNLFLLFCLVFKEQSNI